MRVKRLNGAFLFFEVLLLCALCFGFRQLSLEGTKIIKGPYVQFITPTSATVLWELNQADSGWVRYGEGRECRWALGTAVPKKFHEYTLYGLKPDTLYYYTVYSGGVKSRVESFRTQPLETSRLRFVVYGDSRSNPGVHTEVARLIQRLRPDFILHTGDLVGAGRSYGLWGKEFFSPLRRVLASIPLYPALGNHEQNSPLYYRFFHLPAPEAWYSFKWGNAGFFCFDSNRTGEVLEEELRWLAEALSRSTAEWKFVFFHHPLFSAGPHPSAASLRKSLHPLLSRYGVDIAFCGHNHLYQRTFPISTRASEGASPVIYITTGGGGAPLYPSTEKSWSSFTFSGYHICLVEVVGSQLLLRALELRGNEFDRLELRKGEASLYALFAEDAVVMEYIEKKLAVLRLKASLRKAVENKFKLKNPFDEPLSIELKLTDDHIKPSQLKLDIEPGKSVKAVFLVPPPTSLSSVEAEASIVCGLGRVRRKLEFPVLVRRSLEVPRLPKPPRVDGLPKETEWNRAKELGAFLGVESSQPELSARLGRTSSALYLSLKSRENQRLRSGWFPRDAVPEDEDVFVVLMRTGSGFYQLLFNPLGSIADARNDDFEWDGKWRVRTRMLKGVWVSEVMIPFEAVGLKRHPEKDWKFNIIRFRRSKPLAGWCSLKPDRQGTVGEIEF